MSSSDRSDGLTSAAGDDVGPRQLQARNPRGAYLDQNRQLQLAAADDLDLSGVSVAHPCGSTRCEQLLARDDSLSGCEVEVLTLAASHRRGIQREDHVHRRLVDRTRRIRDLMLLSVMVFADRDVLMAARKTLLAGRALLMSTRLRHSKEYSW